MYATTYLMRGDCFNLYRHWIMHSISMAVKSNIGSKIGEVFIGQIICLSENIC